MKRRVALSGTRLDVTLEQNGKVVRTANAEVNLPNMLMTVFSSMPRGQGEVPFAVGRDGRIYTPTPENRTVLEPLAPAKLRNGASMFRDWIIVMTQDPSGSGLRLGIARPVGDSLSELRRAAVRNAGLGFLFIGLSLVLIVPLSGRLTRNLSTLTGAARRIAHGEYHTRVNVKSKDEIGELAGAFNQMAADIEVQQRAIVGQERLKRELELGRQIQQDMQPQQALRLGLTEIQGVSVPAREVGGDFFNYFALPDGKIALVVGDVSGKGVGAALLMSNIQASLRTRFALGQDLCALVDAIDRDIEANSPGQMYATIFIGILDPAARTLRYVNAGHHPQYVLRRGGLERMGATGLPTGLLAGRGYTERIVQLKAGDLIFFYTDGCPETENDREEFFGSERLEELLTGVTSSGPDDVLQRVETALKTFRGVQEPFDDATMMAVKVG
jgi:sigma-B regulation protein RsbU (phosphoserine phosphatase)